MFLQNLKEFLILHDLDCAGEKMSYFIEAFTHCSWNGSAGFIIETHEKIHTYEMDKNTTIDTTSNYERLEFLGDSLINYVVSKHLFTLQISEGSMSIKRSLLVSSDCLSKIAKKLSLMSLCRLSGGININSIPRISGDLYESFSAAIYLTHGLEVAERFINKTLLNSSDLNDVPSL